MPGVEKNGGFWTLVAPMFGSILTIVGGVGWLVLTPIQAQLDAHKQELEKINTLMTPLLTLYAQESSNTAILVKMQTAIEGKLGRDLFDQNVTALQRQITEILEQIHKLEADIVSRSENKNEWDALGARISVLDGEISALQLRVQTLSDARNEPRGPPK